MRKIRNNLLFWYISWWIWRTWLLWDLEDHLICRYERLQKHAWSSSLLFGVVRRMLPSFFSSFPMSHFHRSSILCFRFRTTGRNIAFLGTVAAWVCDHLVSIFVSLDKSKKQGSLPSINLASYFSSLFFKSGSSFSVYKYASGNVVNIHPFVKQIFGYLRPLIYVVAVYLEAWILHSKMI